VRETPDDGQRNCPKHVEFYSKNKFEKLVHLVGFTIRISIPFHPLAQTSYSSTATTNGSSLRTADNSNEDMTSTTAGIWSPLLEDWALSVVPRDQKVMKNKPFYITQPGDKPPGGAGKEVTETDLYLLGAIEKLVYRVDFMEKRLRRTEELLHLIMANSNQNQGKRNSYASIMPRPGQSEALCNVMSLPPCRQVKSGCGMDKWNSNPCNSAGAFLLNSYIMHNKGPFLWGKAARWQL